LGLLDKDQTGSMNDALGKDDSSDDPLQVLAPSLHAPFFILPRYIKRHININYISPPFLAPARGDTRTTLSALQITRYRIQNSTHVRGSLVCFYPIPIPVVPWAEFDFTWSRH
jgi:hypothetical protein